jgi:ClpP class serine protease
VIARSTNTTGIVLDPLELGSNRADARRRFAPSAMLALDPRAWGMYFDEPPDRSNVHRGTTVLVNVRGPLMHHADAYCDSYDAIKARVLEAIASKPTAIVLSLDSPGGLVSGCFETAAEIRAACAAAGIPLYAYVDGAALSAAYALACAASKIVVPSTGAVGSIGVIDMVVDQTALDAALGVRVELVASGARKTDGNPHTPITDEALGAVRANIEALADVFFEHVAAARGANVDAVRALQAAIVTGARAIPLGLADEVRTLDELVAALAEGSFAPADAGQGKGTPVIKASKAYEDAIAALRKAADSDDEKEAARAKRMLAAELAEGDEPAKEEPPKEDEPASKSAKAEGGDEPPKKDDEEAKALAGRAMQAAARAEKATEDLERRQLIASRPDFDESTRALLASSPLADVRAYVEKAPRKAPQSAAASTVVQATRGEHQGGPAAVQTAQQRSIASVMGIATSTESGPRMEGTKQTFPVMTRADRAKYTEARSKAELSS